MKLLKTPIEKTQAASFVKGEGVFPSSKPYEMFNMNRKWLVLAQKKACFSVQPPSYLVNGDGQLEDLTSV